MTRFSHSVREQSVRQCCLVMLCDNVWERKSGLITCRGEREGETLAVSLVWITLCQD